MRKGDYAAHWRQNWGVLPELPLSFAAVACLCLLTLPGWQLAALFICVLVHEAGHLIAARLLGAGDIRLRPGVFGFEISYAPLTLSPWRKCVTALAGPFAGAVLWHALRTAPWAMASGAARLSLVLSLVNLLPLSLLDGGALCHGALCCVVDSVMADRICFCLDIAVLSLILAGALYTFLSGGGWAGTIIALCLVISYCGKR